MSNTYTSSQIRTIPYVIVAKNSNTLENATVGKDLTVSGKIINTELSNRLQVIEDNINNEDLHTTTEEARWLVKCIEEGTIEVNGSKYVLSTDSLSKLDDRIYTLEGQVNTLEGQVNSHDTNKETNDSKLKQELSSKINNLNDTLTTKINSSTASLTSEIDELKNTVETFNETVNDFNDTVDNHIQKFTVPQIKEWAREAVINYYDTYNTINEINYLNEEGNEITKSSFAVEKGKIYAAFSTVDCVIYTDEEMTNKLCSVVANEQKLFKAKETSTYYTNTNLIEIY